MSGGAREDAADQSAGALEKLRPYLRTRTPIPNDLMVAAFNTASLGSDDRSYRQAADEFLPGAGIYLHPIELSWFVSGRGTDDEARQSIQHRQAYAGRAAVLLPTLLSLLGASADSGLELGLRLIDDFCRDFPAIKATPHEKRARKEFTAGIKRTINAVGALNSLLEQYGHHIDIEFDHHMAALNRPTREDRFATTFKTLRDDLRRLALAGEIILYRESSSRSGLIITNNKIKTQTVRCMYQLCLWENPGLFVTTPGSDFATACSLLYEIASGERDASLAGAINKFAKSVDRKDMDEEERSFQWDNSDEGMRAREADNFASVREETLKLQREVSFWETALQSRDWDRFSRRELLKRKTKALNQLERALIGTGPHLVWGDQVMRAYGGPHFDEMGETHTRLVNAEIALGRAIRRSGGD